MLATAPTLSPRQREVAALIVEGLTNGEIAQRLTVTHHTVDGHIERLVKAFGARSSRHLCVLLGRWSGHREGVLAVGG